MDKRPELALQISTHSFDGYEKFCDYWCNIKVQHDLYIATDSRCCYDQLKTLKCANACCLNVYVDYYEMNADVKLLFSQMRKLKFKYLFLLHIQVDFFSDEEELFNISKYLYRNFLGSTRYFNDVYDMLRKDNNLGLIAPFAHPLKLKKQYNYIAMEGLTNFVNYLGFQCEDKLFGQPITCNSFLMNYEIFASICNYFKDDVLSTAEFDNLQSFYIEQVWRLAVKSHKKNILRHNYFIKKQQISNDDCFVIYAHYSKDSEISPDDYDCLKKLQSTFKNVVLVSNGSLNSLSKKKISAINVDILIRSNVGYDFGAWKDAINKYKEQFNKYKYLLLVNNSCITPMFGFGEFYEYFSNSELDFWGISEYPEMKDGSWLSVEKIDEHLQSYCLAFSDKVFKSQAFTNFWDKYKMSNQYEKTIVNGEMGISSALTDAGFKYGVFVEGSSCFNQIFATTGPQVYYPTAYLLAGSPFLKKKSEKNLDYLEKYKLLQLLKNYDTYKAGNFDNYIIPNNMRVSIDNKGKKILVVDFEYALFSYADIHEKIECYKQIMGCYKNKIFTLNNDINQLKNKYMQTKLDYDNLVNSISWKIVKPFRWILLRLKRLFKYKH